MLKTRKNKAKIFRFSKKPTIYYNLVPYLISRFYHNVVNRLNHFFTLFYRFDSNFDRGTRENHENVLSLVMRL